LPAKSWLWALGLLGVALAAAGAPAAASPDLSIEVAVEPAAEGGALTALSEAVAVVTVENKGLDAAAPFEIDIWADNATGGIVLPPHTVNVTGLAPGANLSIRDPMAFAPPLAGDIRVHAVADPAHRVNDTQRGDNDALVVVYFGPPPAAREEEDVAQRSSGARTLPAYSYLAFRLALRDGDALIFEANSQEGALFDCYLLEAEAYERYREAREAAPANATVEFLGDYSRVKTDHIAFTADPLPSGTYFLVIDNDDRLQSGQASQGPVRVDYAVAIVNNSLPWWAAIVALAAAAAAIWAIVRWRPHFDVRSPLLAVPAPSPEELEGEGEQPDAPPSLNDEDDTAAEPPGSR
jgi:hypothetical protein